MELYLAALIGAILYAIFDLIGKIGNDVFTKKYLLATLVNVLTGAALIWFTHLKEGVMQIAWFDAARLIAAFFGITGQKIFKSLIDLADKNTKTKFGVNRN